MQQPRIWLVEDEQSIADTLVYMLQQEGFQVSVFGRGLPALEAARISARCRHPRRRLAGYQRLRALSASADALSGAAGAVF